MPIHLLPEAVAVRIAAGEVVERPASVVKELVENSLDAGATRLEIETQEGGLRLIRVRDNGHGIPADEVELAFRRHATSKITVAEDLDHIATLGFRGEALASIAAVARVTCTTRHRDAESGLRLRIEGGEVISSTPIGYPVGTEMRIEDLFYNVPARRKFLSSARSERKHCDAFLTRYAIAYPHIAFTVIHDGRTVLNTPGNGRADEALVQVYGLDLARSLLPIIPQAGPDGLVRVRGYVGDTNTHRADRGYITLFVNGRWIHDLRLTYAVIQAYHTLLPINRYPVAFLMLDLAPEDVDVNVHPAKTEIRLRDPDAVFRMVLHAVRSTILDVAPLAATWSSEDVRARQALRAQLAALTPARPVPQEDEEGRTRAQAPTLWDATEDATSQTAQRVHPLLSAGLPPREETPGALSQGVGGLASEALSGPGGALSQGAGEALSQGPEGAVASRHGGAARPGDASAWAWPQATPDTSAGPLSPKPAFAAPGAAAVEQESGERLPPLRVLGQVATMYIVAEGPDGLYLIDQHAAHERILYEALLEGGLAGRGESQALLQPVAVSLPLDAATQLEALLPSLPALGFEVEPFGPMTFLVRAVPAQFQHVPPAELLADLTADEDRPLAALQGRQEEALARRICKRAAIKAGQTLSRAEMEALVQALARTRSPRTCPHGRPILIRLGLDQLARQFWR